MPTQRKSWNNESRKRATDEGEPNDMVLVHVEMKRWARAKFKRMAEKHPVHQGMSPLMRALAHAWMNGDISLDNLRGSE